jgi:hypothetical protein
MSKTHKSFSVAECKVQASHLLKSLHSDDVKSAQKAAKRFQIVPDFKTFSVEEIIQTDMKRKHALTVIALEKGFKSWADLKTQLPFIRGGFLNHWFATYEEAKIFQNKNGGFLLPYRGQFFICDGNYIRNLGFNPQDEDWDRIGYDWARPRNRDAWQQLSKKWMEIQKAENK